MYVVDDQGNRIVCPHPVEMETVLGVLGEDAPSELIKERTGFNSYWLCLDCLKKFEADLGGGVLGNFRKGKDKRECPECKSSNVRTTLELVGEICPRCEKGKIESIFVGYT